MLKNKRKIYKNLLRKAFKALGFLVFGLLFVSSQIQVFGAFEGHVVNVVAELKNWAPNHLIITKVYYDVGDDYGTEPDNEWVELRNPTDSPIDISGWIIEDNNSQDTIPSADFIPAGGFALITGNVTTWDYWDIPSEVVKIVLSDWEIGNGLANDSDRVIIKKSDQTEVDAVSWGDDTYAFDPACPGVDEGNILARIKKILDGSEFFIDTNKASDWKEVAIPYVEVVYPNGLETWWVGRTYIIRWIADNPNGLDSELSVDIYYSADSGSTWAQIGEDLSDTGIYEWRVPLFINGYYVPSAQGRIKVVVTGPENFMISAWDMSDRDFCPPIDYSLLTPEELDFLIGLGLYSFEDAAEFGPEGGEIIETEEEGIEEIIEVEEQSENVTEDGDGEIEETIEEVTNEEPEIVEEAAEEETEIENIEEAEDMMEEETTEEEIAEEVAGEEIIEEPLEEETDIEEEPLQPSDEGEGQAEDTEEIIEEEVGETSESLDEPEQVLEEDSGEEEILEILDEVQEATKPEPLIEEDDDLEEEDEDNENNSEETDE